MKRKPVSPLRYVIGIPLAAIGVAMFLYGFISQLKGHGSKSSNSTTSSESVTSTTAESTPAAKPEPATPADQITDIVSDIDRDISDIKVFQGQDGLFKVSFFYDGESWTETRLINKLLTYYVDMCKQAYQIDGVGNIECFVFGNMMDARGNSDKEKIFAISMNKENFKKYNWENIAFVPGSADTIIKDCDLFDIHAGIQKNIDFSELYYMGK